jgi:hypothetical protein
VSRPEWRRICWPDPGVVCLHGGCGYCNYERFRKVSTIRRWAMSQPDDIWEAFVVGVSNDFYNAETK